MNALTQALEVRGHSFRNRLVQAPMCAMYASADGSVTPQVIEYYRARALGGAALIIVEITFTDRLGSRAFHAQLGAHDDTMIPGLGELAQAIKEGGAIAGLQLGHCGPQRVVAEPPVVAPSPIPWAPGKRVPHELTLGEIEAIVDDHREAGRRLAQAGFELVELHGAHGYLLNAFLCPVTNTRTDRYGGSPENRRRFPLEVVRAVREAIGAKRLLSFRLNGDDLLPGGLGIEAYRGIARELAQAGVDIVHVSGGTYRVMERRIPPMYLPEAPFAAYARPIREAAGVPVIASGTIHDLDLAERLVREGEADFVSMARPMFADAALARKVVENRAADIRPCIRCNTCLAREQGGLRGYCAVNPRTGREHLALAPAVRRKSVAVIGAGPAGIEAALTAADRGHAVTLYERTSGIGGQLAAAAKMPFKSTLPRLLRYYERALEQANVKLECGSAPSPASVDAQAIILATGRRSPGVGCTDALRNPEALGERITVVGANTRGAELAWWLGALGKHVTLVERDADFDDDVNLIQRLVLPKALADARVSVLFNSEFAAARDGETIVFACGGEPDLPGSLDAWRDGGRQVELAGECAGARALLGATTSGFRAALRLG